MPFGIPSEDFHGGFGIPHEEGRGNGMVYDSMAQTVKEVKEEVYEDIIFDLNDILCSLADQGCMLDEELDRWCEVMKKFREVKGFE